MVSLNKLIIPFFFLLTGCAKLDYLWDQGRGQLKLLTKARDNKEVLNDIRVSPDHKGKIKKIIQYKDYFYQFWEKRPADIYNQTHFLENKAVTYLVIASPFNTIKAKQECFPFMGCFPYLGFFSEQKALDHARELEKEDWVTYTRPVYAYSSLGYFSDPILSSFFYYNDRQLAELIFHELFHTIFFAKDEVDLNENMANYFAKKMLEQYFSDTPEVKKRIAEQNQRKKRINRKIVSLVQKLDKQYKTQSQLAKDKAQELFNSFMESEFRPELEQKCREENIDSCWPLKREWNNASMVAFLTYEEQESKLSTLHLNLGLSLKEFFDYIVRQYDAYRDQDDIDSFETYLFSGKKL